MHSIASFLVDKKKKSKFLDVLVFTKKNQEWCNTTLLEDKGVCGLEPLQSMFYMDANNAPTTIGCYFLNLKLILKLSIIGGEREQQTHVE